MLAADDCKYSAPRRNKQTEKTIVGGYQSAIVHSCEHFQAFSSVIRKQNFIPLKLSWEEECRVLKIVESIETI